MSNSKLEPLMYYKNGFKLEACPRMPPFKGDMTQAPNMFIAREKSWQYQISRNWILYYFNILTFDTPLGRVIGMLS